MIALGGGRMPSFVDLPLPLIERLTAYLLHPDDPTKATGGARRRGPGAQSTYVTAGYVYLRDEQGIPINTPPWGTLSAIDLAPGDPLADPASASIPSSWRRAAARAARTTAARS